MTTPLSSIDPGSQSVLQRRLSQVQENIAQAAARSGRSPGDVQLLPVTKYVSAPIMAELASLGCTSFAENRVQDLRAKSEELAQWNPSWVLIGRLQSNKAGQASRIVSQVQSVDSVRIAQALSRNFGLNERVGSLLLQVNVSGEETKTGFTPEELPAVLDQVRDLPAVSVDGFMTMAPFTDDESVLRETFSTLRELRDRVAPDLPQLSMGMSQDYEIAIEEGATIVRVGSAIFN